MTSNLWPLGIQAFSATYLKLVRYGQGSNLRVCQSFLKSVILLHKEDLVQTITLITLPNEKESHVVTVQSPSQNTRCKGIRIRNVVLRWVKPIFFHFFALLNPIGPGRFCDAYLPGGGCFSIPPSKMTFYFKKGSFFTLI